MGGLGTVSSQLLNSLGIGKIKIIDFDVIEQSNLPRQTLYTVDDIGKAKVEQAKIQLSKRNPFTKVEDVMTRIDAINVTNLITGVDLIIDGLDKFTTRRILFRAARSLKIPYIFAGAIAETGNVMSFNHDDEYPCLECIIGDTTDDESQSCEIRGVNPVILHLTAGIQVNEAMKILLDKKPDLLGKMQLIDVTELDFDLINIAKKDNCALCSIEKDNLEKGTVGDTTKGEREIGKHGKSLITSLCGRDTYIFDPKWDINWNFTEITDSISKQWNVKSTGRDYITFNIRTTSISLVNTGIATIRSAGKIKNAINVMNELFDYIKK